MICKRYRDMLSDVAAGAAAPAEVEAHLASCAACRAELAALRQALAVADDEMARLLLAEPSPELAARIRSAVAEPGASPGWRLGWLWPALAIAAALLVALAVVGGRGPTREPDVAVETRSPQPAGTARAPTSPPPVEPAVAMSTPRAGDTPIRPRLAQLRAAPAAPEVLVPAGEAETLLRLVALVHRNRLAPTTLGAAGAPSADLAELGPIDIPALEIVPLDPAETSGT